MTTSILFSSEFLDQLDDRTLNKKFYDLARTRAKDLAYWIGEKDKKVAAPDGVVMYIIIEDTWWIEYRYKPMNDELIVARIHTIESAE